MNMEGSTPVTANMSGGKTSLHSLIEVQMTYLCKLCGQGFNSEASIMEHIQTNCHLNAVSEKGDATNDGEKNNRPVVPSSVKDQQPADTQSNMADTKADNDQALTPTDIDLSVTESINLDIQKPQIVEVSVPVVAGNAGAVELPIVIKPDDSGESQAKRVRRQNDIMQGSRRSTRVRKVKRFYDDDEDHDSQNKDKKPLVSELNQDVENVSDSNSSPIRNNVTKVMKSEHRDRNPVGRPGRGRKRKLDILECLYCMVYFPTPLETLLHMEKVHNSFVLPERKSVETLMTENSAEVGSSSKKLGGKDDKTLLPSEPAENEVACATVSVEEIIASEVDVTIPQESDPSQINKDVSETTSADSGVTDSSGQVTQTVPTDEAAEEVTENNENDADVEEGVDAGIPEVRCMMCPCCKRPLQERNIFRHLLSYHAWKPFKGKKPKRKLEPSTCLCDLCGKSYSYPQNLKVHILRDHEGVKNPYRKKKFSEIPRPTFTCEVCGYITSERRRLRCHIMAFHENNIPYHCEYCDFKTWERTAIRDHRYRHMKEKPYKCEHCQYQCIQKPMLRAHLLRHHGIVLPKSNKSSKPRWKLLDEQRQEMSAKKDNGILEEISDGGFTIKREVNDVEVINDVQASTVVAADSLLQMHGDLSMHTYSQVLPEGQGIQTISISTDDQDPASSIIIDGGTAETEELAVEFAEQTTAVESLVAEGPEAADNQQGKKSPTKVILTTPPGQQMTTEDLQQVWMQLSQSLGSLDGKEIVFIMSQQGATDT